ncbi:MAG TPA: DUF4011 domain-containing protein, partial [Chitinophagales bacterium]|nr:DUF4011 domain-containing protein [Chitinophagales bacterium]
MSHTTTNSISFLQFLDEANAKGGFHNDDIVAIVLPLFEEVLTFHESGKVAPLQSLQHILITNDKLDIDERFILPKRSNQAGLDAISNTKSKAFEVTAQTRLTGTITDTGIYHDVSNILEDVTQPITHPVYMVAYHCYEHHLNHHDELTDIFQLGVILASVALGLDFNQPDELRTFVNERENLKYSNQKLHPAIANLIVEMTELLRHRRSRDLYDIIDRLKNYRNYNPETEYDLSLVAGFQKQDISSKQKWILNRLKSRLFDISRRNRLLYFKPNLRFVNLTAASVPNVVNISNIKPESLFTWNSEIAGKIAGTHDIALSKYLRFEDNPYLPAYLDKLRTEAERDRNEFGSSQLRLVACFLNWYNFKDKDKAGERIQTPLVLIPVKLIKKKGVKDQYLLQPQDNEAEVNPVLVYLLKELYSLQLPDKINLAETSIETLFDELKKQIAGNNSGIMLELIDKPRIKFIQTLAKQVLSQYNRRLRNRGTHFEHYKNLDYSYNHNHFQPLGLQLYRKYVEPKVSYAQWLIDENAKAAPLNHATASEKERSVFTLDNDNTNPYRWEFDMCSMVLGNFNYKKISLVSDYNTIAENNISSTVFNDIFSEQPKSSYNSNSTPPLQHQYPVV